MTAEKLEKPESLKSRKGYEKPQAGIEELVGSVLCDEGCKNNGNNNKNEFYFETSDLCFYIKNKEETLSNGRKEILLKAEKISNPLLFSNCGLIRAKDVKNEYGETEKGYMIYNWNGFVLQKIGGPYKEIKENMEEKKISCMESNGSKIDYKAKDYYFKKQCVDKDNGVYVVEKNIKELLFEKKVLAKGTEIIHKQGTNLYIIKDNNTYIIYKWDGNKLEKIGGPYLKMQEDIDENKFIFEDSEGNNNEYTYKDGSNTNANELIIKDKTISTLRIDNKDYPREIGECAGSYKNENKGENNSIEATNLFTDDKGALKIVYNNSGFTQIRLEYNDGSKSKNKKVTNLYVINEKDGNNKSLVSLGKNGEVIKLTEGENISINQIGNNLYVIDNGNNKSLISQGKEGEVKSLLDESKIYKDINRVKYKGHRLRLIILKIEPENFENSKKSEKYEVIELLENNTKINSLGEYSKVVEDVGYGPDKKKGLACQSKKNELNSDEVYRNEGINNGLDKVFYYGDYRRNTEVVGYEDGFVILKRKVKFKGTIFHPKGKYGDVFYLADKNRNILLESKNKLEFSSKQDNSILISEEINDGKKSDNITYKLYKFYKGNKKGEGKEGIYYLGEFETKNLPNDYNILEGGTPVKCKMKYGDPYHFDN